MTLSEAWDRLFWSLILVVLVGLLWMKFLQDVATCESVGVIVAFAVGIAFFYRGAHQANLRNKRERQAEEDESDIVQIPEDLL